MRPLGEVARMQTRPEDCPLHGPYLSRKLCGDVWMRCPACIEAQHRQQREQEQASARQVRQLTWVRRLGRAGIPERFQSRSLDNFEATTPAQRRALAFAREYVEGFEAVRASGRGAIFVGRPGTGKTHLAAAIGMALLHKGHSVLFATVMRALRLVKDSWAAGATMTESQAVALLTGPDLLILDEVGVQFGSDFERQMLFDVLNERYERRRPTLLLSNLPLAEAVEYLGARVLDRLREDGGKHVVFDWESYRARMAGDGWA